jgi:hypothetical protein
MLSVHSFLARLTAPLVARNRFGAARMLERFARAELGSSLVMRWAAAETPSHERRAAYLLHALDEERHARLFLRRARQLGAPVQPLAADADPLFRLLGERRFLAFVHRAEARGAREFEAYRRSFAAAGDRATAALFGAVLRDERRHVEYSRRLGASLGASLFVYATVAAWEAARSARRAVRVVLGGVYFTVMLVVYATVLPFSLVAHARSRRRAISTRTGQRAPALEH